MGSNYEYVVQVKGKKYVRSVFPLAAEKVKDGTQQLIQQHKHSFILLFDHKIYYVKVGKKYFSGHRKQTYWILNGIAPSPHNFTKEYKKTLFCP